jgi:site-specific recombinase XerD
MNKPPSQALFALVESFFTGYLPRQRGASVHTIRAYRDSLKLLFEFTAQHRRRDVASLDVADLDAEAITAFLDHIEANRSTLPPRAIAGVRPSAAFSSTSSAMI